MRRLKSAMVASWLLAAAPAGAAGVSVEAATPEQSTAASDKYRTGMTQFQEEKFAEALETFKQSYDAVASPNSHLMIVRTLSKMGKVAAAYAEIDAVIREAEKATEKSDKYKKTLDAVRAEKDDLKTKVGFVVVNVQASVSVGGRTLDASELGRRVAVDPGATDVVLKLPSGEEERQHVEVQAGKETKVEIVAPGATAVAAAPATPSPTCPPAAPVVEKSGIDQRTLGIIAGGVGIAGFATFAVFGVLDNGKYDELKNSCPNGVCPRTLSEEAEAGRMYQTLANVGLGVGIVGVVSSVLLFVTAPSHSKERTAVRKIPEIALGPGFVSVKDTF